MHTQRARPATRFLAILAIIITAVVSGGRNVQAFTNPFALGSLDTLDCSSGSPVLLLSIKNTSSMSVSQYGNQWTMPTLYVAYQKADGTYYNAQPYTIPNIAAQTEQKMLPIGVLRADTTFTIAIHATDPSKNVVKLLTGTTITPVDHCPLPSKFVTTTVPQNSVAQQAQSNINAAALAEYVKTTPTNISFPKGGACFKLTAAPTESCVSNPGSGLTVAWGYNNPNAPGVGFRVYRVDNGQHTYLTSVSSKLNVYAAVLPAPKTGDFAGQCFAVVAVRNGVETDLSPSKCAKSNDSLHEIVVKPDIDWSYALINQPGGGFEGKTGIGETRVSSVAKPFINWSGGGVPSVGYAYDTDKMVSGDAEENMVVRYFAHFDVTAYAGHVIQKAALRIVPSESLVKFTPATGNCATEAAPAKARPTSHQDVFNDIYTKTSAGPVDPANFRLLNAGVADFSSIVENWVLEPTTNFGIVVRGRDENFGAFTEDSCITKIFPAALDIQYF